MSTQIFKPRFAFLPKEKAAERFLAAAWRDDVNNDNSSKNHFTETIVAIPQTGLGCIANLVIRKTLLGTLPWGRARISKRGMLIVILGMEIIHRLAVITFQITIL